MRLTYETGVATMIQFILLSFLNIANSADSIITTCTHSGGSCATNMLSSVVYYILLVSWFGVVAAIGYSAQAKRSKRMSRYLIASELAIFLVAAVNIKLGIKAHSGALSLFTSFADLVFSVWIMTLAYRLMRAGNARVVSRRRPPHHDDHASSKS
jgi:hypothetical protein